MAEPLQLPPPLEGDISLRTLGRLAGRLDNIDLSVLMVYLVDIVDSSALPWLGEQFSLFGDGWERRPGTGIMTTTMAMTMTTTIIIIITT